MEAHIENLHNQVIQTDAYKEVKTELDELKEGQAELNHKVDTGFEKGRATMSEHKRDIAALKSEVGDMRKELADVKTQMTTQHSELLSAIKDKENDRLRGELKEMIEEKHVRENRIWDIIKIVVGSVATIAVAAYLVATGIK